MKIISWWTMGGRKFRLGRARKNAERKVQQVKSRNPERPKKRPEKAKCKAGSSENVSFNLLLVVGDNTRKMVPIC